MDAPDPARRHRHRDRRCRQPVAAAREAARARGADGGAGRGRGGRRPVRRGRRPCSATRPPAASWTRPTRQDYRRALDAYDAASPRWTGCTKPDDIRGITGILEDGRYAIACVQARLAGKPVPARLPPCFFNPQHGPSGENVDWAPPGGVPRSVPACAADAERVRAGAEPDVRKVPVGAGRPPYWQGGRGYGPYAQGYFSPFATSGLLPGLFLGSMLSGGFGGGDGSYSDGYQDGQDASGDGGSATAVTAVTAATAATAAADGGGDDGDGGGYDGGGGGLRRRRLRRWRRLRRRRLRRRRGFGWSARLRIGGRRLDELGAASRARPWCAAGGRPRRPSR